MNQELAIEAFSALAHEKRLGVFRLLVREHPKGIPVGMISRGLNLVPSTLSGHLLILKRAGLVSATRHHREIHYAANLEAMNRMIGFLLADCCDGQVENCSEILTLLKN